ncbi:ankyrin repeat domain-containing protein 17-like [Sycon ciliatum]|uniref:ankyrin repeat domain-containing protein 17-like n=1 Tax=Sycon ciliatum TaxID=27933 RepID=UPI0031F6AD07
METEEKLDLQSSEGDCAVLCAQTEAEASLDAMLSLACRQGKQDIVELLLESGSLVNHRNKAGNTPLLEACSQGHVDVARLLLDRGSVIDAPTELKSDSALTWACTLGKKLIVHLLLTRGANVEHRTKDGCTALMCAALAGHEQVANLLLDYGAEINAQSDSNKDSPLTFACRKGHHDVVESLLNRSAHIEHCTKEGFTPLMFAALCGHTAVADLLLVQGAKVNVPSGSNNDIPLTHACCKGHHSVVKSLLEYGSNLEHRTKDGCTPLMLAAREGHLSVAMLILEYGAKLNSPSGNENNIPLTLACWKGHCEVVELLLHHDSDLEHHNKAGCSPLMLAAREGHVEATELVLEHGAEINVPSGWNDDTPLTLASWKGHAEVVELLLSNKSNVDHQTKTGCTPLMEATREGHALVAQLLLEYGAELQVLEAVCQRIHKPNLCVQKDSVITLKLFK